MWCSLRRSFVSLCAEGAVARLVADEEKETFLDYVVVATQLRISHDILHADGLCAYALKIMLRVHFFSDTWRCVLPLKTEHERARLV